VKGSHIGNWLNGGAGIFGTLLVQATWQGSETLFAQNFSYGSGAEAKVAVLEDFADLVDGVILFPQLNDEIP